MSSSSSEKSLTGFLLVHFGCPSSLGIGDTYRFLVEIFDRIHEKKVGVFQAILSRAIFAPLALSLTLKRYRNIHTALGFPLMQHCQQLVSSLNSKLGANLVLLSMQHGQPAIEDVCKELKKQCFEKIVIMPLYPQRVPGMTQSIYTRAHHALMLLKTPAREVFIEDFHLDDWYINPIVEMLKKHCGGYEHFLFSYHSVPEKDGSLYKQQCQETSLEVMKRAKIKTSWSIGFQSKMTHGRWLQEESRDQVINLAQKGVKTLLVLAPGFITPCSETMLDIEIELRELFLRNGGERLDLLPPLCCQESFIAGFSTYLSHL